MALPRVLLAITVYNGRMVVPACLTSAAAMVHSHATVDVLVLDDASPEPGFSESVEVQCNTLGIQYYRSPRNLGIPRNVNLALLRAMDQQYDYVLVANSDVIFPNHLVDRLIETAAADATIGSVTAWSNNVSIFSLPNSDASTNLADQDVINWISDSLYGNFGSAAVDIPVGISFCILIPVPVVQQVGLMDPVFGRGYCEETDWTLRSQQLGFRICMSPSSFTYHRGTGSNVDAGLVSAGHTSVPAHELIVDHRYPLFRSQVQAFVNSELLEHLRRDARQKILSDAAREWGYTVVAGLTEVHPDGNGPTVTISNVNGSYMAIGHFIGFDQILPRFEDIPLGITEFFGRPPTKVQVIEPSGPLSHMASGFVDTKTSVEEAVCYPTRV